MPFRTKLDELSIAYEAIDIHESMKNLKEFLKERDTQVAFEPIKQMGRVGVPCLVTSEGEYLFELEELEERYLFK